MGLKGTALAIEVLKTIRVTWMTKEDLVIALEGVASTSGIRRALDELVRAGVVTDREGAKRRARGIPPREFALSKAWGGVA